MEEKDVLLYGYSVNEPIFIEDLIIHNPSRSRQWIDHELNVLSASGQIKRYATGIYYIPSKDRNGYSKLDVNKVINNKYIHRSDKVFGYVSGDSLLKVLKLIIDEPDEITIVTNKEKSRGRNVMIGNKKIRLIKSPTEITKDNVTVLRFLEAVRMVDVRDQLALSRLEEHIIKCHVTFLEVHQYCIYFPDAVSKKILGTRLIQALINKERYG